MEVAEGLDTGGVYAWRRPPIASDDTLDVPAGTAGRHGQPRCWSAAHARAWRAHPAGRGAHLRGQDRPDRAGDRLAAPGRRARPPRAPRRRLDHLPGPPAEALAGRPGRRRAGSPSPARPGRSTASWWPPARARSSWSRSSRRARPASRPRRGATAPAPAPTSGWARDRRPAPPPGGGTGAASSAPGGGGPPAGRRALVRIDAEGAYANLVLPADARTQRARSAATGPSSPSWSTAPPACGGPATGWSTASCPTPSASTAAARAWLRLGAFQLAFLDTPAHAAVGATVEAAPRRLKGLLNAVLRKVVGVAAGDLARRSASGSASPTGSSSRLVRRPRGATTPSRRWRR